MLTTNQIVLVAVMLVCLVVYCITVRMMFRKDKMGFRRRWHALDYIWVPLGGITVVTLIALLWHMR
jgi:NADH:ubiquinone oxidoreductase subunit 6 (subunit J)